MRAITTGDFDANLKPKTEKLKDAFDSVKKQEEKSAEDPTVNTGEQGKPAAKSKKVKPEGSGEEQDSANTGEQGGNE